MKTWIIEPVNGAAYEIEAETYEFDATTGRHLFKDGEEIVANLLNVSVRQKQDS